MKLADTLSSEDLIIECFWKSVSYCQGETTALPSEAIYLYRCLVLLRACLKQHSVPEYSSSSLSAGKFPKLLAVGGWTHCSNGRKSLPKSQRCVRLWDLSIQTEKMTRRKVVSALLNRSNSQLAVAAHQNTISHFNLFVYFENSPPREETATQEKELQLIMLHMSVHAHCTQHRWFFYFFLLLAKKFPAFSTHVHTCTCGCCPWYSHGFSSQQSMHTKHILAANPK